MANKISVVIDLAVDKANRGIKSFQKSIKDADGAVGKFKAGANSAFTSMQANAGQFGMAAGAAIIAVGVKSVKAASSLEQSVGAIESAFGDASDAILEMSKTADQSFGLSARAFNEAAVQFSGAAIRISEDTGRPVAEVLQTLIARSADLAATFGGPVSEAIDKVAAGLAGESEPLRRWNIDVRKTAVESHAAANGMEDAADMTKIFGAILNDSSRFAGQFNREANTLEGSTQRLAAQTENAFAAIGEQLIPVVTEATMAVNDLASAAELNADHADHMTTAWRASMGGVGLVTTAYTKFANFMRDDATNSLSNRYVPALYEVVGATGAVADATDDATEATESFEDRQDRLAKATKRAIDAITSEYDRLNDKLSDRSAYLDIEDAFADVGEAAKRAADKAGKSLEEQSQDARDAERSVIGLKQRVADYAREVGKLPPKTTTDILAMIDEGKLMEAAVKLENLERTREVRFNAVFGGSRGTIQRPGMPDVALAGGGITTGPTTALLGDNPSGKEAVIPLDDPKAKAMLGGTSGPNVNVTVHALDPQAAANAVAEALKVWERRNGRRL